MGIGDLFGFGKRPPFKVPAEVTALRTRIAAEERENYPSLARFRDLQRDAAVVTRLLNAIIAQKDYAEDALRIHEDIKKRMEALEARIVNNMREAKHEGSPEYVESNLDYLERKSMRNAAKALFTEFLEAHELLARQGGRGEQDQEHQLHTATARILQAAWDLQARYFSAHGDDREIRGMQEAMCRKLKELNSLFARTGAAIKDQTVRANLRKIAALAEGCR
jgi:hypothetical protein